MSEKLSEQVKAITAALSGLGKDLASLDDIQAKIAYEKGALEQVQAQRKQEQAGLGSDKAKVESDLAKARSDLEIIRNDGAKELASVNSAITGAKAKLVELEGQLQAKIAHHNQIEASLQALKAKFG